MKMNRKLAPGFTLVELLVVIVIIAALAGLTAPMVIRQRKKADQTEAISNVRQIGLGMIDFEADYGSFPDDDTADDVAENTGSSLTMSGSDSNNYFKQLIATGIATQESVFYCKSPVTTRKPDNVFNTDTEALKAGEVGFGYIMLGGNTGLTTSGNTARPVVVAPLKDGSTTEFDSNYYDGKAVLLKMDGSVATATVPASGGNAGKAVISGKSVMDTGDNTVWGTPGTDGAPGILAPKK